MLRNTVAAASSPSRPRSRQGHEPVRPVRAPGIPAAPSPSRPRSEPAASPRSCSRSPVSAVPRPTSRRRSRTSSPRSAARCWPTICALDSGPRSPPPRRTCCSTGRWCPAGRSRLFVLALIVPVLLTTIDGLARARRRGHAVWRWLVLVLAAAVPFVLARAGGARRASGRACCRSRRRPGRRPGRCRCTPRESPSWRSRPSWPSARSCCCARWRSASRARAAPGRDGTMRRAAARAPSRRCCSCSALVTLAIWLSNPFAAAAARPGAAPVDVGRSAPTCASASRSAWCCCSSGWSRWRWWSLYYAVTLGFGPLDAVWNATLLIAGQARRPAGGAGVERCPGLRGDRGRDPRRGGPPAAARAGPGHGSRAGHLRRPGSLGGTESALRR